MGYPITCPECNNHKGWNDMDGFWVECEFCDGKGWVDEDLLDDSDEDDD